MSPASAVALCCLLAADPAPHPGKYFRITVVDGQTGRGVPLVELATVNQVRYVTDSNGIVAFHEPGLMDRTVFFHVKSHGYEFAKDRFGFRGKALHVTQGGSGRLDIQRINIAERLYRVTGGGIYRDSMLVNHPVPLEQPLLNGLVFGSDSVVNTTYRGRLYWFWGDTLRPAYPLGNFHVPGATSQLPAAGGLNPQIGVNLTYFLDDEGFAKPTARMPGKGPTWIDALVALPAGGKDERLFAAYVKVRGWLEIYERGLVEFNDETHEFEKLVEFDMAAPVFPAGHPFKLAHHGVEYVYFTDPYPLVRVRAEPEHLQRLSSYEAFTCLKQHSRLDPAHADRAQLDRAEDGQLRWAWKTDTPAVGPHQQSRLVEAGQLKPHEALLQLQDADTGQGVIAHRGSVYWNEYRQRWVLVAVESGGTSPLGEIWYAEADTPLGPWAYARKVVTHDKYSFYNPKRHPAFDQDGGRVIFFEGTYTHTFSGNPEQTPRYDYNQVMYKLDLADERLVLPVATYEERSAGAGGGLAASRSALAGAGQQAAIAFFALDRPRAGSVGVYQWEERPGVFALEVGAPPPSAAGVQAVPLFYSIPAHAQKPPATTVPLYEYVHKDGRARRYSTDEALAAGEYARADRPLCRVWRNPVGVEIPWE